MAACTCIKPSVNLVDAAQFELNMLQEWDAATDLQQECNIHHAIQRYETFWLPLRAAYPREKLEPPLDVAIVWHVHTLTPVMYQQDCIKMFGVLLPRQLFSPYQLKRAIATASRLWDERYAEEPFRAAEVAESFTFKRRAIGYDLFAATLRQTGFFYQVSLMHYRDKKFLKRALLRYKRFLQLRHLHRDKPLVATYDVELMWQVHQAHPVEYKADCESVYGCTLDHDDADADRSDSSKPNATDKKTGKIWQATYREPFFADGAMWRGISMQGRLQTTNLSRLRRYTTVAYQMEKVRSSSDEVTRTPVGITTLYPHLEGSTTEEIQDRVEVTHKLVSNGATAFKVRVTHAQQPAISAVRVAKKGGETLVHSHLIGNEQLPRDTTVQWWRRDHSFRSTAERAMLVKDNSGDAFLVKGCWVKSSGYAIKFASNIFPPGRMKYTVFDLKEGNAKQHVFFDPGKSLTVLYGGMDVDFQTGSITLEPTNPERIPAQIALALSFGVLTALCVPNTRAIGELDSTNVFTRWSRDLVLLSGAGFLERDFIPTNHYLAAATATRSA